MRLAMIRMNESRRGLANNSPYLNPSFMLQLHVSTFIRHNDEHLVPRHC